MAGDGDRGQQEEPEAEGGGEFGEAEEIKRQDERGGEDVRHQQAGEPGGGGEDRQGGAEGEVEAGGGRGDRGAGEPEQVGDQQALRGQGEPEREAEMEEGEQGAVDEGLIPDHLRLAALDEEGVGVAEDQRIVVQQGGPGEEQGAQEDGNQRKVFFF